MTHHDDASTFTDVLARFGDDGTKELFRGLLEQALQDLIDAELTAKIGASRHERTDSRSNYRNGARERTLSSPSGDLELRIPKLRVGSFFPSLLEPRRRVDKALWAVIMTAYITGTSTRKVDDLVKALGCDTGRAKGRAVPTANGAYLLSLAVPPRRSRDRENHGACLLARRANWPATLLFTAPTTCSISIRSRNTETSTVPLASRFDAYAMSFCLPATSFATTRSDGSRHRASAG